jgi:hypothetical protein
VKCRIRKFDIERLNFTFGMGFGNFRLANLGTNPTGWQKSKIYRLKNVSKVLVPKVFPRFAILKKPPGTHERGDE